MSFQLSGSLTNTYKLYVPAGTWTPAISRSAPVISVVAALAPARQTGYVQSFESNPASPKIWRPRMEGAPYLMVIRLPAIVAEALAEGLAKSNSAMPIKAMKNLGVLISEYYTSRTLHVTMARLGGRGQFDVSRLSRYFECRLDTGTENRRRLHG